MLTIYNKEGSFYMIGFCCTIVIICYAVFVLIWLMQKKRLAEYDVQDIQEKITAGKTANMMLEHFGLLSDVSLNEENKETDEDEQIEDNDEEDVQETESRSYLTTSKFQFEKIEEGNEETKFQYDNAEPTETETKKETYQQVQEISGTMNYGNDDKDGVYFVSLTEDLYHSNSFTAIGVAAFEASSIYCMKHKSILYSIISLLSAIPKVILQIAWIFFIMIMFNTIYVSPAFLIGATAVTVLSFVLCFLEIFYQNKIADTAVNELIALSVIHENEVQDMVNLCGSLAIRHTVNCFSFLKWFLKKFLGYSL